MSISAVVCAQCLCNHRPPISMERGSSTVSSAIWYQWGWLCDHSRLGLLKVSVSVLLRALCYHCVLPCAARLQLLNLEVEEQQAASWQGTFCSFLVYLSIPNDPVMGNNWHLPDLAVFMYHSQMKFLQTEVNLLGTLTLPKSAWNCWEPLFSSFSV